MKKRTLTQLLDDNRFAMGLSFFLAVLLWIIVSVVISPEKTVDVKDVPVQLSYNAAAYQSLGLDVVQEGEHTVDISVTGPRSVVGALSADDFTVYPQTTQVTGAGRYDLPIMVTKVNTLSEYQIIGVSPSTVNVWFDQTISRKFAVETELSGVSVAQGYLLGKSYTTPAEVTVTGPEQEVSRVSRVVARASLTGELKSTVLSNEELLMYDTEGALLENTHITFDRPQVEVTVPVLKSAELPLRLRFTNVPAGFDTATLPYTLSADNISVAGPAATLANMEHLEAGTLDLQKFALDEDYTFNIELPTGFVNLDNLDEVTVHFDESSLSTVSVSISNIELSGAPAGSKVTAQTQHMSVRLIGETGALAALNEEDIVAQVDCSALTVSRGQQTLSARVVIPSTGAVFAAGTYTVVVNVQPVE